MKIKLLAGLAVLCLAVACGGNTSSENTSSGTSVNESVEKSLGEQLISKSDCSACHSKSTKLVGPSYKDIATKYTEADITSLAGKIINGGSGVWGDVPMSAHPQVSQEDAEEMMKYILTLK